MQKKRNMQLLILQPRIRKFNIKKAVKLNDRVLKLIDRFFKTNNFKKKLSVLQVDYFFLGLECILIVRQCGKWTNLPLF